MGRLIVITTIVALSGCVGGGTGNQPITVQKCPAIEPVFECDDICPFDAALPDEIGGLQEELLVCRDSDYCKTRKLEIWSDEWKDCDET